MRNLIAQEGLSQRCEEKLEVFKTLKVFHSMNTPPRGPLGKIQRLRLVGAIEKSETKRGLGLPDAGRVITGKA